MEPKSEVWAEQNKNLVTFQCDDITKQAIDFMPSEKETKVSSKRKLTQHE